MGRKVSIMKRSAWNTLVVDTAIAVSILKPIPVYTARKLLGVFFEKLAQTTSGGVRVVIPEFGVFTPSSRRARKGRHPLTGDPIELPEVKTIRFRPHKRLRT